MAGIVSHYPFYLVLNYARDFQCSSKNVICKKNNDDNKTVRSSVSYNPMNNGILVEVILNLRYST